MGLKHPFFFYGGEKIPTIRSEYTIEQFEEAFQKRAYQIALDAIQKLPTQPKDHPYTNLQIAATGSKLQLVSVPGETIKFENGVFYSKTQAKGETITFTVEEKLYSQSNHSTKISFYSDPKEVKKDESKILAIIDGLMVGIKPMPRFSLSSRTTK